MSQVPCLWAILLALRLCHGVCLPHNEDGFRWAAGEDTGLASVPPLIASGLLLDPPPLPFNFPSYALLPSSSQLQPSPAQPHRPDLCHYYPLLVARSDPDKSNPFPALISLFPVSRFERGEAGRD